MLGRYLGRGIARGTHGAVLQPAVPRGSIARLLSSERGGMTEAMYNWRVAAVQNALKKMGKETGPE